MRYIINEKQDKIVLKELLKNELGLSTRLIISLKQRENGILVNGRHENVLKTLNAGDVVELDFADKEEDTSEYLEKTNIPIKIIYEDENFTIVNKDANMPTHQSLKHYTDTLANALAYRYRERPYVFRAINRLDKDTSGVVVTANNRFFADVLSRKLKSGGFHKKYIAIVSGRIDIDGKIDAPIKREKESIITRIVSPDGDAATTEYKPLLACDDISVLLVTPITGRTHQIRVHMASIGHPIIGDDLYGSSSEYIDRQALHAYTLKIDGIGEFKAPIPDDMMELIRRYFENDEIS
ncbi:MAG: RluA family pseudouridine synthase [Clostridia bacterium]|nr:RluA family pseudouridine synthase [Clostridia bacterium]